MDLQRIIHEAMPNWEEQSIETLDDGGFKITLSRTIKHERNTDD